MAGASVVVLVSVILRLNIDVVKDAIESLDLSWSSTILSQQFVSTGLDGRIVRAASGSL